MTVLPLLRMFGALALVLGGLAGALWAVRRFDLRLPGRIGNGPRPARRLELVERLAVDPRRSLVLVRRDGREYLLLIAPEGHLVVEAVDSPPGVPVPAFGDLVARHAPPARTADRALPTPKPPTRKPTTRKPTTTKPNTTKPNTTKPNTTKPNTTKPTTTKPNTTKPTTTKPNTTKPITTKPTTTKPNTTKPNTAKPNTAKPNTTKPNTTKPNTTKPNTTKPTTTKPTTPKPRARARVKRETSDA